MRISKAVYVLGILSCKAVAQEACFEVDDPKWTEMRAEMDAMAASGDLTAEEAERYKCDPRLLNQELSDPSKVTTTLTKADPTAPDLVLGENGELAFKDSAEAASFAAKKKKKCVEGYFLTHEMGKPVLLKAQQSINWCFDGKKVSDWSGVCTGSVTKLGRAMYWSFDSCSQNDWIPYKLNGKKDGGIHHKTMHNFTNKIPWTYDWTTTLEQWGHYDGSIDQMVDGRLLHR